MATTTRTRKIENVPTHAQFAYGPDGVPAVVHRVPGRNGDSTVFTLRYGTGKAEVVVEVPRGTEVLWAPLADAVACKDCGAEMIRRPHGAYACTPCNRRYQEERRAAQRAARAAGDPNYTRLVYKETEESRKAQAERARAEARVERLMAMLAASPKTMPQAYSA